MVSIRVDSRQPDDGQVARAAAVVRAGGIVAYPTDTLYGLAADPASRGAIGQLYRIKGRQVDQAIPLIASGIEQVEGCAGPLGPVARRLAERFWPGPLSLVIHAWAGLDGTVHAGLETVAVRVPAHAVARALAAACGWPITSTSANPTGQPATALPDVVRVALEGRVDAILDAGPAPGGPASTIVDTTGTTVRLVRAGAVPWEHVLECLA
jgi:L-threonylcarbamoyladenylate synthase